MGIGLRKTLIPGQKICRASWSMLQALSADDATTSSTSSSTESEVEAPTHSIIDSAVINISFELCSVSPLERRGKS